MMELSSTLWYRTMKLAQFYKNNVSNSTFLYSLYQKAKSDVPTQLTIMAMNFYRWLGVQWK